MSSEECEDKYEPETWVYDMDLEDLDTYESIIRQCAPCNGCSEELKMIANARKFRLELEEERMARKEKNLIEKTI